MIKINQVNDYKPTNDYMFGRIFGDPDSENILKDFIQAVLPDMQIKKLEYIKQAFVDKKDFTKKFGKLDIVATLNNNVKVNIEMQMKNLHNAVSRSLYYLERLSTDELNKKDNYSGLKKSVSIWILNYDLFSNGTYHDVSHLKRDFNNEILTDLLELHYIQLPKFKSECKLISTKLEQWLTFIINENIKEIEAMDNENIKVAEEKLEQLNSDEEARMYAEYVLDAKRTENDALAYERNAGREEGLAQEKKQIAKKMLSKNLSIDLISEITGLSTDEINNLKTE